MFLLFVTASLHGQEKLNSDLADQTDSPELVETGAFQLETGYLHVTYTKESPSWIIRAMLRYAFAKHFELRLNSEDGIGRDRYIEEALESGYPFSLSTKVVFIKGQTNLPDLALVSYFGLPFTARTKTQEGYWPQTHVLAVEQKVIESARLTFNVAAQQEAYSPHWGLRTNIQLMIDLNDKAGMFSEFYSLYTQRSAPSHNLAAGITWSSMSVLQLHLAASRTLNPLFPHYSIWGGLAYVVK
jgi:hypothetical protein